MAEVLIQHKSIPASGRHAPHSLEYLNEAARLAATNLTASDVHKLALQLDTGTLWRLKSVSPIEWQGVGIESWTQIKNKPSVFPPDLHTHTPEQVGTPTYVANAISGLKSEIDPFPQYTTAAEVDTVVQPKFTQIDAAIATKAPLTHVSDHTNPHGVTKAQVQLGNVENIAPLDMPVSTAMQAALDTKTDIGHTHNVFEVEGAVRSVNGKYPNANGAVTIDVGGASGEEFQRFKKRSYFGIKILES